MTTRAEFLDRLLTQLLDNPDADLRLTLRTRDPGDPTVALLDAWATAADVIAFYTDRIRAEGYLTTAEQDASVLALAALVGASPRMPVAAGTRLAYTLQADRADAAVVLPAGLMVQSVPGPGEQPQVFETTSELTARPSWNVLLPRSRRPLSDDDVTRPLQLELRVAVPLAARDMLLLTRGSGADATRTVLRVMSVATDLLAGRTRVAVQPSTPATLAAAPAASDGAQRPAAAGAVVGAPAAGTAAELLDSVLTDLSRRPSRPPPVAPNPATTFAPGSDAIPRIVGILRPEVSGTLYRALGTSTSQPADVPVLAGLRNTAAPFGAQAQPRTVFDDRGRPIAVDEWALGGEHVVTGTLSAAELTALLVRAALPAHQAAALRQRVARVAAGNREQQSGVAGLALVTAAGPDTGPRSRIAETGRLSTVHFTTDSSLQITGAGAQGITFTYTDPKLPTARFTITAAVTPEGAVTFTEGDATLSWDPAVDTDLHGQLGTSRRLDITWNARADVVTARVRTALPLPDPTVLHLDSRHDEIAPGTPVLITGHAVPDGAGPGLLTTVTAAQTVSVAQYGISARVTRLTLAKPWVGNSVSLGEVRDVGVWTPGDPLPLEPVAVATEVSGDRIELDRLHAGLDAGREVVVTGTRTDLPGASETPAAELAVVTGVEVVVDPVPGGTPYTALRLTAPLAYRYRRDTVRVFGSVVAARHGATRIEVLGDGRPEQARQSFTLSTGPTLADLVDGGPVSSLVVHVDGLRYREVPFLAEDTSPTSYLTGLDQTGRTTVTFAAPLPAGKGNVTTTYRSGRGADGNLGAHRISQLVSRPLAVSEVDNPLPASGGADQEGADSLRRRIPVGLPSLGRAVSVDDYVDLAASWPGVGRVTAAVVHNGGGPVVHVCAAGSAAAPLGPDSPVITGLQQTLAMADPFTVVWVDPVELFVLAVRARILPDPDRTWDSVAAGVRDRLRAAFAYVERRPGQPVYASAVMRAAHQVPGVVACTVTGLALLSAVPSAADVAKLAADLGQGPPAVLPLERGDRPGTDGAPAPPAQLAFVDPDLDNLIVLEETAS